VIKTLEDSDQFENDAILVTEHGAAKGDRAKKVVASFVPDGHKSVR
jgi:hypothetical protein